MYHSRGEVNLQPKNTTQTNTFDQYVIIVVDVMVLQGVCVEKYLFVHTEFLNEFIKNNNKKIT